MSSPVQVYRRPGGFPVTIVVLNRPEARNAVDRPTAEALSQAFREFDKDENSNVAILHGSNSNFCAGADLRAMAESNGERVNRLSDDMHEDGPMGITRMRLSKPVIASVEGYCVAGGFELACWCDLRVANPDAQFGVLCRLRGVPLIDGGTLRLPELIGRSRALDLILTGRLISAKEALDIGLVNRIAASTSRNLPDSLPLELRNSLSLRSAFDLALLLSSHPQTCLRNDRLSVYRAYGKEELEALKIEFEHGMNTLSSGEFLSGSREFIQKKSKL
ncbi:uncharacterized protein VTP21DRAFT_5102 [Calcarisporiella thermophila]|uniref:uncharacterized protein n=1 Tax=Calcarisporiella thermophila TaxID=911321 RepID=UPI0037424BF9